MSSCARRSTTFRSSSTWWTSIRPSGRRSRRPARRRVRGSTRARRAGSRRSRSTSRAAPSRRFSRPTSERDTLRALVPGARIEVMQNGVDAASLRPPGPPPASQTVVFCGVMNYPPNEEGAVWLAREVWPRVRLARPGRAPRAGRVVPHAPGSAARQRRGWRRRHRARRGRAAAPMAGGGRGRAAAHGPRRAEQGPGGRGGRPASGRDPGGPRRSSGRGPARVRARQRRVRIRRRAHRFPRPLACSAPPSRRAGRRRVHFMGTSAWAARGPPARGHSTT